MSVIHSKTLKISIEGGAGCGKTTFAEALVKLCQDHGVEVVNRDGDAWSDHPLDLRLKSFGRTGGKVIIDTIHKVSR